MSRNSMFEPNNTSRNGLGCMHSWSVAVATFDGDYSEGHHRVSLFCSKCASFVHEQRLWDLDDE